MSPLSTTLDPYEVGFVTGSQDLYGEETLQQVAEQSQEIVRLLGESGLPVKVVWKPVLLDAASIHRQVLDANSDPGCVGVITWMHTFSPAKMWIAGLDALRKPLLHLHTQAGMELPWSTMSLSSADGRPMVVAMLIVRATSSNITAALTASRALVPMVKGPC